MFAVQPLSSTIAALFSGRHFKLTHYRKITDEDSENSGLNTSRLLISIPISPIQDIVDNVRINTSF